MGSALSFLSALVVDPAPASGDVQRFRRGGPLRLLGVELETPESIDLILQLLHNVWVNEKHEHHVKGCLSVAARQKQDVLDHQFFYDKTCTRSCGSRRSDVYISHVAIKKGEMKNRSAAATLSKDDVHELVKNMSNGWFSSYKRYADILRKNGVNGPLLSELTDEDLQELGISNRLHRRRIVLEIQSLAEGRSWQTFDIFICSVGFSSDTNALKSKEEVEEMLVEEIRNACSQQEFFIGNTSSCSSDSPSAAKDPLHCSIADALPHDLVDCHNQSFTMTNVQAEPPQQSGSASASEAPEEQIAAAPLPEGLENVVPPEPSESPTQWRVGEEVLFSANGRGKAPVQAVVAKIHPNGNYVKVEYSSPRGGQEVTPWVAEGTRLQRRAQQEDQLSRSMSYPF